MRMDWGGKGESRAVCENRKSENSSAYDILVKKTYENHGTTRNDTVNDAQQSTQP